MGTIVTILPGAIVTVLVSVVQLGAIVTGLQCVAIGVLVQRCNITLSDAVFAPERMCVNMVRFTPCSVTIDPVPEVNCNS